MKKLSLLIFTVFAVFGLKAQTANVQVIHNSPDALIDTIDVYVNGSLTFDDFIFREATPLTPVPAGSAITLGIAPGNSQSYGDTLGTIELPPLTASTNYALIATGLADSTNYPLNPEGLATSFQLLVYGPALTSATSGNVNILVSHGAPDAPSVDINLLDQNQSPTGLSIDSVEYGGFSTQGGNPSYIQLPANDFLIDLSTVGGTDIATYYAPLSAFDGGAGIVFASGFVTPGQPYSFGLYLALPDGSVVEIPVIGSAAQIIHNAADPAAEFVDVYFVEQLTGNDGVIAMLDNFGFRTATDYTPFPSRVPFKVYVADSSSSSYTDSLAVFDFPAGLAQGQLYSIIANGVLDPNNFTANPDGESIAFDLYVYDQARASAQPQSNVNVIAFHGATDAPTVDIDIRGLTGTEIDDLTYGNFSGSYLSFTPQDIKLDVTNAAGTSVIDSFSATLSLATGAAVTAFASGFIDDSQGAEFGLFAALPINLGGRFVIPLPKLDAGTFVNEASVFTSLNLYPNPTSDFLRIDYNLKESNDFEIRLVDVNGKVMTAKDLGTVPAGNDRVEFNVSGLSSGTYFVQMIFGQKDFIVKPVIVD